MDEKCNFCNIKLITDFEHCGQHERIEKCISPPNHTESLVTQTNVRPQETKERKSVFSSILQRKMKINASIVKIMVVIGVLPIRIMLRGLINE